MWGCGGTLQNIGIWYSRFKRFGQGLCEVKIYSERDRFPSRSKFRTWSAFSLIDAWNLPMRLVLPSFRSAFSPNNAKFHQFGQKQPALGIVMRSRNKEERDWVQKEGKKQYGIHTHPRGIGSFFLCLVIDEINQVNRQIGKAQPRFRCRGLLKMRIIRFHDC